MFKNNTISCIIFLFYQAGHYGARAEIQNQAELGEREQTGQTGIQESKSVSKMIL